MDYRWAGHSHWQSIDAKTAALNEGCAETLHALQGERVFWQGKRLAVTIEGHKANKSSYDLDNLTGALKSHLDGIAATLGINDNQITITIIRGQPGEEDPPRDTGDTPAMIIIFAALANFSPCSPCQS